MAARTGHTAKTDERTIAGGLTRAKLIATAERLVAEQGLGSVSVRDITSAAGVNPASLHYHFGSKDGLIRAVLEDRDPIISSLRSKHLDALPAKPTVAELADAMVSPVYEMVTIEAGEASYVGFLAALVDHVEMVPTVEEHLDPSHEQYVEVFARARPELPTAVLHARVSFAFHIIVNGLAQPPRALRVWIRDHDEEGQAALRRDLAAFVAGGLGAPG